MLQRALSNLLDNAIKFSPSDGRIRCTVVRDADDWVASIQDDGPGIAPQDQLQIFQPFTRVNTAGSTFVLRLPASPPPG
nr:sensor histidine kinase [Bordetella parapertussis]